MTLGAASVTSDN